MYNEEVLNLIKEGGKGLVLKKRDYKIVLEEAKAEAEKENRKYEYSIVYSMVYDGENSVKLTYIDYPSIFKGDYYDMDKQYTGFKYITLTLDRIKTLKFID